MTLQEISERIKPYIGKQNQQYRALTYMLAPTVNATMVDRLLSKDECKEVIKLLGVLDENKGQFDYDYEFVHGAWYDCPES